jgi:UDP-glucose 4-epimerase
MKILLTGGTGYIASHTALVLAEAGHEVILYDNLSNSNLSVVDRLVTITGQNYIFIRGDVRDTELLSRTLKQYNIDAVIHFAGLKALGESIEKPIDYYDNNICGTISLLQSMQASNVKNLVFSSSATVYGNPQYLPLDEEHPITANNPYGRSKLYIEEMLGDVVLSTQLTSVNTAGWCVTNLRYFNPVGAHESGLIGEDPNGIPNNLMPYIAQVAAGKLPHLNIFGGDYNTPDGTGVRDYIHVMDLAKGHLAALNNLNIQVTDNSTLQTYNLGTGTGYSVLDMVKAFELASGRHIPIIIRERRLGDIATCYANADKAKSELGWKATETLENMCKSTWHYQQSQLAHV